MTGRHTLRVDHEEVANRVVVVRFEERLSLGGKNARVRSWYRYHFLPTATLEVSGTPESIPPEQGPARLPWWTWVFVLGALAALPVAVVSNSPASSGSAMLIGSLVGAWTATAAFACILVGVQHWSPTRSVLMMALATALAWASLLVVT